jgi:hypothetical protein
MPDSYIASADASADGATDTIASTASPNLPRYFQEPYPDLPQNTDFRWTGGKVEEKELKKLWKGLKGYHQDRNW